MIDLSGINAIVTGSTRGLGLAIASALANSGANVVINGRSAQACSSAITSLGHTRGAISYVVGSIADEGTAQALVDHCQTQFGPVTFVVNNAGVTRDKSLVNMTVEEFDEVVSVHLRGSWLMCRAAARAMKSAGGAIVNVTSGSALFGLVGQSNYAAAKGGVNALTRALSVELRRYDIRVNALYPVALTDMTTPVLALSGGAASPLHDVFGEPADVARIAVALADSRARQVTGQIIGFDGHELALWSHPERVYRIERPAPWSDHSLLGAIQRLIANPAPLNPDEVGARTRAALAAHRSTPPGSDAINGNR
ncbi:SDR family NAD(P)-dependent oxidoreductase [Mycolicibacterium sp. lyk4-40-TYG-92]|uniref:SDR family NAD(P)-dependent oxidoreductase n=1 Tax=Mycolicibacterium sp. lyk4-40-TYG-92 TaxID=3040295 RepID=UPI00254E42D5|nr:SDR family NAD(P)-dependent oxidoreductase [Mycolicibacterium sp. lyk4-40-TYG-92]